ncbi:MAG: RND family transporter [Spirochaetales bacterium]|nr:RND family transporter [Spirochaetales bacterium]
MKSSISGFVDALTRRGWISLLIVGACVITAVIGISRLSIITDFSVFMPSSSKYIDAAEEMSRAFGDADQQILLVRVEDDVESLRSLPALVLKLSGIEGITSVEGPVPEAMAALGDAAFAARIESLKKMTGGALLTEHNGKLWATIRLMLAGDAHPRPIIRDIRRVADGEKLDYLLSGEPYLEAEIFTYVLRILAVLPPVAIILMLGVFRLRIGSFRATALSMIPAIIGAVLTLGAMSWILGSVSILSVLIPIFIIVLGSADGLHITSHVMDRLAAGSGNREAVSETMTAVGVPIIMTTLTTMAGFLSMLLIDSPAIRQMGLAAAGGILVAGLATWLVLPVLLLRQKPLVSAKKHRRGALVKVVSSLRGWPAVVIALAIVCGFVPGILKLKASFSIIDMYKPSTAVRKNIDEVTEILGGSIPVYAVFNIDDPYDPATAQAILSLQQKTEERGIAANSVSIYRIIARANAVIRGVERYPSSSTTAKMLANVIAGMNPSFSRTFISSSGLCRAVFFLPDLEDDTLQSFIDVTAESSRQGGIDIRPVGTAFAIKTMNDRIISQQLYSLLLAAGIVFVLSAFTQKNLWLGLAAVLPILLTLVGLFGTMGYAGIELSVLTGIMSGLTVGVGIDYAIHYVSLFRYARDRKQKDPAKSALDYVATPVLANAIGLSIGFTAMIFSPLRIHVILSVLMWVTMVLSAGLTLTLLPTILGGRRQTGNDNTRSDGGQADV